MVLESGIPIWGKNVNLNPSVIPHTKLVEMEQRYKCKSGNRKLLDEDIGEKLCNFGAGKNV